jgi:preprotein translocase subunit Sec61beta
MARDNKIRMPSGQGGLTRYFDEGHSKIEFPPMAVIIIAVVIMLIVILLHQFGGNFIN